MSSDTRTGTAFDETVVFLRYFDGFPDPRQPGKVTCPLDEILLLCLVAVLAGADCFTEIALFGVKKLRFPRRFLPYRDGTPTHDHLGDILATLDADAFQRCFVAWVAARTGLPEGVIAIDGKTVRRSHHKKTGQAAIHMVSAFAARQRLVLGQVKVAEKSNEIIAIPKLLEMLEIEGAVVTIDAMGCQHRTIDPDHGRIETRDITVIHDVGWLQQRHNWPGLKGVVIVESTREIDNKIEKETRFYITSLALVAHILGPMVRDHWAIENSLHWVLDMVFRDDECRVRTDHAPANFTMIKHMALNLIRRAKGKQSLRASRKAAAWDDDYLASIIVA